MICWTGFVITVRQPHAQELLILKDAMAFWDETSFWGPGILPGASSAMSKKIQRVENIRWYTVCGYSFTSLRYGIQAIKSFVYDNLNRMTSIRKIYSNLCSHVAVLGRHSCFGRAGVESHILTIRWTGSLNLGWALFWAMSRMMQMEILSSSYWWRCYFSNGY